MVGSGLAALILGSFEVGLEGWSWGTHGAWIAIIALAILIPICHAIVPGTLAIIGAYVACSLAGFARRSWTGIALAILGNVFSGLVLGATGEIAAVASKRYGPNAPTATIVALNVLQALWVGLRTSRLLNEKRGPWKFAAIALYASVLALSVGAPYLWVERFLHPGHIANPTVPASASFHSSQQRTGARLVPGAAAESAYQSLFEKALRNDAEGCWNDASQQVRTQMTILSSLSDVCLPLRKNPKGLLLAALQRLSPMPAPLMLDDLCTSFGQASNTLVKLCRSDGTWRIEEVRSQWRDLVSGAAQCQVVQP